MLNHATGSRGQPFHLVLAVPSSRSLWPYAHVQLDYGPTLMCSWTEAPFVTLVAWFITFIRAMHSDTLEGSSNWVSSRQASQRAQGGVCWDTREACNVPRVVGSIMSIASATRNTNIRSTTPSTLLLGSIACPQHAHSTPASPQSHRPRAQPHYSASQHNNITRAAENNVQRAARWKVGLGVS